MMKMKENNGITLIALIITIIVLLILAGVTINALTGNESAMEKATQAREKNEQGAELDAIKLAVVNSVVSGLNGFVDKTALKQGLNGLIQESPEDVIVGDGPWVITSTLGRVYEINKNSIVNELTGVVLTPKTLTLTIEGETYEEKTIVAKLIDIDGTLSWSESTDKIDIIPSEDNKSATIKAKKGGTETITVTCSNGDIATCNVTITESLEEVKIDQSYVGYYAYVDGIYGIIYADLLMQDPTADKSPWGNSAGAWELPVVSDASTYKSYKYRRLKTSDKTFGNKTNTGVISLKSETTGTNRFYIMELTDRGAKWDQAKDMKSGITNSWKCPSKVEWSIFASAFEITPSNRYGLLQRYWTCTKCGPESAYMVDFEKGYISADWFSSTKNVRLCTTF